jgi:hypothetical protein
MVHLLGPGKGRATVTTPALSGEEGKAIVGEGDFDVVLVV